MKFFLIFFLLPLGLYAEESLLIDAKLSPYMGGSDFLFAHSCLRTTEDYFLSSPQKNQVLKILGRTLEQVVFWQILNSTLDVAQHEFFGHGYRLRDCGVHPQSYLITPWMGLTSFSLPGNFKVGELLAVSIAGLEAEAILAYQAKFNWMQSGTIDGRLSTLYTQAQQSAFWYTLITKLGRLADDNIQGNDIESYLLLLNASYDSKTTLSSLIKWSVCSWLDPMTFFAYISWFYYIFKGCPWQFPAFTFRENIRYLPNIRIGYAPYGPEAYLENFFSFNCHPVYFYCKGGQRSAGVGVAFDRFFARETFILGGSLDLWYQNKFISTANVEQLFYEQNVARSSLNQKVFGGCVMFSSKIYFSDCNAFVLQVGGKTAGYLPGYSLFSDIILRIGISIGTL